MAAPYDHDALWLKAKMFINRAMDDGDMRSPDEKSLWAALSLELLGKAALARVSPTLIAEPTDDVVHVLIASGLIRGDGRFISARAQTSAKKRSSPSISEKRRLSRAPGMSTSTAAALDF